MRFWVLLWFKLWIFVVNRDKKIWIFSFGTFSFGIFSMVPNRVSLRRRKRGLGNVVCRKEI